LPESGKQRGPLDLSALISAFTQAVPVATDIDPRHRDHLVRQGGVLKGALRDDLAENVAEAVPGGAGVALLGIPGPQQLNNLRRCLREQFLDRDGLSSLP
jgi:hypothetical protein